ncbi:Aromatic acid exporter family member 1 [Alkalithermobacter thermoalcaliphilus JW-YL-7 = DSM 7308]|uniref:Aromatic acid exporter family member 1 n=1 Tax=Alkalithermobacter thermoalcaliphilus JW-YL-7 = DSM 7308 TaxID=1121328 RepID=A0A150FRT4_CLOPD|nr:protein of unknown function DUF939 [[Clostridium] paradoxum JW-YL-7 = DSM 7308]SHK38727.1 Aromatic acid exporter family member 1 [[Clostridium] paradoxum JW-YL-7 = DSM 7308]
MKIGMRTIKTGIAVFLCVLIFKLFNMGSAMYAVLAAVISMQNTVIYSFKAGKNRMLGTFIGALVGLICALIKPESAILSGIGVMIVIHIANLLKSKETLPIAAVVFSAIMLKLEQESAIVYSLSRIIDTFIGIVIAISVNYFISPPKYFEKIDSKYKKVIDDTLNIVKMSICYNQTINSSLIIEDIQTLEKLIHTYIQEFRFRKSEKIEIEKIKESLNECKKVLLNLQILDSFKNKEQLDEENIKNLAKVYNCRLSYKEKDETKESVVYNYHIKNIIKSINKLNSLSIR